MRFTPSTEFTPIAKGGSKLITWKFYARRTNSLSDALTGTWTDISDRIRDIPDIAQRIEYNFGQFAADAVTLEGKGIDWLKKALFGITPDSLPDLSLWLNADAITGLKDGDAISSWSDLSGNGFHAIQGTAGYRPIYKTNILNGKPVVRFDGTDDRLEIPDNELLDFDTSNFTIYAVFIRHTNAGTSLRLLSKGATSDTDNGYSIYASDTDLWANICNGTTRPVTNAVHNGVNNVSVITAHYDRKYAISLFVEGGLGSAQSLDGFTGSISSANKLWIGSSDVPSLYWDGDIAELVIVGHDSDHWEREGIENYLALKWGAGFRKKYVEIKIEAQIAGASDVVPVFCGFVDTEKLPSSNEPDTIRFTSFTAEDVGTKIAAENISTQYVMPAGSLGGNDGLIFKSIPNLFLTSANVTSYVLKTGIHRITYNNDGTKKWAKLDDGAYVELTADSTAYTLGNAAASASDTERVTIYVTTRAGMPSAVAEVEDYIIVLTQGTTLPNQWYRNITTRKLLQKLYEQIGLSSITFDNMNLDTYDGRYDITYFDAPAYGTNCFAMIGDGMDLWVAVDRYIYKRTASTLTWAQKLDLGTGEKVSRLFFNGRNHHLWILHGTGSNAAAKLTLFNTSTEAKLGSTLTLFGAADQGRCYEVALMDYEYNPSGPSYKYGFIYINSSAPAVRFVWWQGSYLQDDLVRNYSSDSDTYYSIDGGLYIKAAGSLFYHVSNGGLLRYRKLHVDATGAWVMDGLQLRDSTLSWCVINESEGYVYGITSAETLYRHAENSSSGSQVTGISHVQAIFYDDVSHLVYGIGSDNATSTVCFFSVSAGTLTVLAHGADLPADDGYHFRAIIRQDGILYGMDRYVVLYQCHTALNFYVEDANFEGMKVTDALRKILNSFFLVGIIRASKAVYVYRRADKYGTPQTTGNTVSVTVTDLSDLEEISHWAPKVDWVEISNASAVKSYNGITFDAQVLSDKTPFTLMSDYTPTVMLPDLCFSIFNFFKVDKGLYTLELGGIPLWQYEPLDGFSLYILTTNIRKNMSGVIYGTIIRGNGSVIFEGLLNNG